MRHVSGACVCLAVLALTPSGCGSGGSGNAGANGASLTGDWVISGSVGATGVTRAGTLSIAPHAFSLTLDSATLAFSETGAATLAWTNPWRGQSAIFQVNRTPSAVDLGVIPLDVGGDWTFSDPITGANCNASLSADAFSGQCAGVTGLPRGFPSMNAHVTAHRASSAASSFGTLGGTWLLVSDVGGQCNVSFNGNVMVASCSATHTVLDGTLTFTLADGVGSGSSDRGLEVAAVRK